MTRKGRWLTLCCLGLASGCGGAQSSATAPGNSDNARNAVTDDHSLCDRFVHWRHDPTLEASETTGPGAFHPNVRRIFKVVGERDNRHTVLLCREIDSNLDGIKDLVRTFTEKGDPLHEEADTNFDGKIDVWLNFADGRIEEEDLDTTFTTGRPNVWKFYVEGALSRVRRNTHCANGHPDVWEIYYGDRLERVGNDSTCDGHVDRWDRDSELLAAEDAAQEKAQAVRNDAGVPAATTDAPAEDDAATADAGSKPSKTSKTKK